jgi:hypothetical protein
VLRAIFSVHGSPSCGWYVSIPAWFPCRSYVSVGRWCGCSYQPFGKVVGPFCVNCRVLELCGAVKAALVRWCPVSNSSPASPPSSTGSPCLIFSLPELFVCFTGCPRALLRPTSAHYMSCWRDCAGIGGGGVKWSTYKIGEDREVEERHEAAVAGTGTNLSPHKLSPAARSSSLLCGRQP